MSQLIPIAAELKNALASLTFSSPVHTVYDPTTYAWDRHCDYLSKYGSNQKRVLFLGMNPGPWGMSQTGVPFGEISFVRDWMKISGPVGKPDIEHPKRPIEGFSCERSEVSGRRLWGLFADQFGTAETFFKDHFVANYCPLVWMAETGRNITPDKLPKGEISPVEVACLKHLSQVISVLDPDHLVGVGAYAKKKLEAVQAASPSRERKINTIIHPSPASPIANRDWPQRPIDQLKEIGIL